MIVSRYSKRIAKLNASLKNLIVNVPSMKVVALFFALISLPIFVNAYAEPIVMEKITSNGMIKVQLIWPEVLPDELYDIQIKFLDPNTNEQLKDARISYEVLVLQHRFTVEHYESQITYTGDATFEVLFPEDSIGTAQVIITVNAINKGLGLVKINENVSFNVEVVPEFSTLTVMIMAISIGAVLVLNKFKTLFFNIYK